jgi:hypothetical protein
MCSESFSKAKKNVLCAVLKRRIQGIMCAASSTPKSYSAWYNVCSRLSSKNLRVKSWHFRFYPLLHTRLERSPKIFRDRPYVSSLLRNRSRKAARGVLKCLIIQLSSESSFSRLVCPSRPSSKHTWAKVMIPPPFSSFSDENGEIF